HPPTPTLFPYTTLFRSGQPPLLAAHLRGLLHPKGVGVVVPPDGVLGGPLVHLLRVTYGGHRFLVEMQIDASFLLDSLHQAHQPRSEEHTSELQSRSDLV